MNAQHTPGPWWSEGDAVLAMLPGGAVVEIARANVLQELRTEAEYANACLIAAAPELLEALEGAQAVIEYPAERLWNSRPANIAARPAHIDAALRRIPAAIAKATGAA